MRRLLTPTILLLFLCAGVIPAPAAAQEWNPCGDAATGTYPAGYDVVWGGNGGTGNQIILGDASAGTLRGGTGHDILCGYGGNDTLVGNSGHDWLDGGAGDDVLKGGSGNDSLVNGETNRPGSGNDAQFTIVTLSACEQLAVDNGHNLDDFDTVIEGTDGDDRLLGQATAGAELVCGFGGADHFNPGSGDVFFGGAGNDSVDRIIGGVFYGGAGNDYVLGLEGTFYGGAGHDLVDFMDAGTFYGGADNDEVSNYFDGTCDSVEDGC